MVSRSRKARPGFPAERFVWSAVQLLGDVLKVLWAMDERAVP